MALRCLPWPFVKVRRFLVTVIDSDPLRDSISRNHDASVVHVLSSSVHQGHCHHCLYCEHPGRRSAFDRAVAGCTKRDTPSGQGNTSLGRDCVVICPVTLDAQFVICA